MTCLQGMVGSDAALGVIPLGTANALAHDLNLPLSAVAAARANLTAKPRRTAVGRVEYLDFDGNRGSRFFIVAAGIGADAHLFYKLNPRVKGQLGMAAYYAMATQIMADSSHGEFCGRDRVGSHSRMYPNCWRFASATSEECCANWLRAHRSNATICGWSCFALAAAWPICATSFGVWWERVGTWAESTWFTA